MEDDKGKERPAKAQEPKAEEEKPEAPAGKGLPKKAILIAGGVVVLLILAAVAYFVFAPSTRASTEGGDTAAVDSGTQDATAEAEATPERAARSSHSSRRGSEEEVPSTNIFMTDFPASVVNLAPSEKYDYVYLKYGFTLELSNEKVRSEIAVQLPRLISIIDGTMSGLQWDKVCNARGRDGVAKDVADAINEHLETGKVIAVHFNTFVAQ
jgi:flagellar basal body-associated protein FliL